MKKAIVLCGGGVKGSYQAGVVKALLESGFEPNAIFGISTGALNATYLVYKVGEQLYRKGVINFAKLGQSIHDFWFNYITQPDSIAIRRGTYELGMSALRKNFEGLLNTDPLRELLKSQISRPKYLKQSPIKLSVGTVNIQSGKMVYAIPEMDNFLDFVLASASIPILMPVIKIGNDPNKAFLDGGLRNVSPIRKAIEEGYEEIVCIACHSAVLNLQDFPYGNLLALVDRIMDIAVNELLNQDLEWAETYTKLHPTINLKIIRPEKSLDIDIQSFGKEDIKNLLDIGYNQGKEIFK